LRKIADGSSGLRKLKTKAEVEDKTDIVGLFVGLGELLYKTLDGSQATGARHAGDEDVEADAPHGETEADGVYSPILGNDGGGRFD